VIVAGGADYCFAQRRCDEDDEEERDEEEKAKENGKCMSLLTGKNV
jgi:hypothetical protein